MDEDKPPAVVTHDVNDRTFQNVLNRIIKHMITIAEGEFDERRLEDDGDQQFVDTDGNECGNDCGESKFQSWPPGRKYRTNHDTLKRAGDIYMRQTQKDYQNQRLSSEKQERVVNGRKNEPFNL